MGKFDDELKKIKIPAIRKIALYLKSRDDIRENLDKENKSLEEMFSYILNHARQKATGGCACLSDEEVYGLAVHYYDEDDLKVDLDPNIKADVVTEEPTVKIEKVSSKKSKNRKKNRNEPNDEQLSLFDMLG